MFIYEIIQLIPLNSFSGSIISVSRVSYDRGQKGIPPGTLYVVFPIEKLDLYYGIVH